MNALALTLTLSLGWVSPEIALTPTSNEPTFGLDAMSITAVASDGTNTLAVWEDDRYPRGIYATRVGANGAALDPQGIRIAVRGSEPSVAFDGTRFLVVYNGDTNPVEAVRVGTNGQVIDTTPIVIATGSLSPDAPSVSFDGTNFVIAMREGSTIDVARVRGDGTIVDATPIRVTSTGGGEHTLARRPVSSASITGTTLLAWSSTSGSTCTVMGARIDSSGALVDTSPLPLTAGSTGIYSDCQPFVGASSTGFAVAWRGYEGSPGPFPWLTAIGATGAASPSVKVSTESTLEHPSAAYVGGAWLVTWDHIREFHAARVSATGTVLDAAPVSLNTAGGRLDNPVIAPASAGGAVAVFGRQMQGWSHFAVGASFITSSSTAAPVNGAISLISRTSPAQTSPSISSSGEEALVVWVEAAANVDRTRVMGRFIGRDGQPRGAAFEVSPGSVFMTKARAAFDGTRHVVTWDQYNGLDGGFDIHAIRVQLDGGLADPASIPIRLGTGDQRYPRVASGNGNSLICWDDNRALQCSRLLADAGVASSFSANTGSLYVAGFDVAWDGQNWLVVWNDESATTSILRSIRVTGAGTTLTPSAPLSTTAGLLVDDISIAPNGNGFGLAYVDDSSPDRIRLVQLKADGGLLPTGSALVQSGTIDDVALTWNGDNYVVSWSESRTGSLNDILVQRYSDAGVELDAQPIIASAALNPEEDMTAANLGGATAIVYGHWDPSVEHQQPRARLRLYSTLSAPGAVCSTGATCGSGACVGNVCCETQCSDSCATGVCSTPVDAGVPDAGTTEDAGVIDTDAGSTGGGAGGGAGGGDVTGTGGGEGGGTEDPGTTAPSGCGCGSVAGSPLLLLLAALIRRRRRS